MSGDAEQPPAPPSDTDSSNEHAVFRRLCMAAAIADSGGGGYLELNAGAGHPEAPAADLPADEPAAEDIAEPGPDFSPDNTGSPRSGSHSGTGKKMLIAIPQPLVGSPLGNY